MIKRIFSTSIQNKPLGRWYKPSSKKIEDIKVLLANYDSCGDIICGTPKELKSDIDKILNEDSNKDFT